MKKFFFAICILGTSLFMTSCGAGGCSIEGEWKVSDVNIESDKFSDMLINTMKDEYLKSTYKFNKDGTMTIGSNTGTYTFSETNLTWADDLSKAENILQVKSCSSSAIELLQRMPPDESKPATAIVTFTIVPK